MTLPFVVRTVQPVLIELDREMEEAARSLGAGEFTTFRRIVFPTSSPAILVGRRARLRAGDRRVSASIVLIAGNLPFKTEVASVYLFQRIEQRRPDGRRRGRPSCCSLISFAVLLG